MRLTNIMEGLVPKISEDQLDKIIRIARELWGQVSPENEEAKNSININIQNKSGNMINVNTTIVCYMAFKNNYIDTNIEDRKNGYVIGGMANPKTMKFWFPIIKFIPYPDVPPKSFDREIASIIIHELAHIQNPVPRDPRVTADARNPMSDHSYAYATDEIDANVNTIVQMYDYIENAKDYTLRQFIQEFMPHMLSKLISSRKARQKLITRLAREGLIFKQSNS